jgi:WD40 repeat protein
MSRCILPEQFQRLLAEQLSEAERQALDAHVDACPRCQETLARLLEADEDTTELDRRLLRRDRPVSTCAPAEDFLRCVKDKPPPLTVTIPYSPNGEMPLDILFPDPPTVAGSLGRLESYHILEELGRGAFGVVFKAYDEKLDCPVALKVLKPELAASVGERRRFEDEARKAAAVRHDHVVRIYRVGGTPGFALPYYVMEYIDGEALSERLRRQGALAPKEAAEIVRQGALGLDAAHARGQVHRDIKPSNILLEKSSGRAKITDFGLARTQEVRTERLTQTGAIAGTPPYMSPEQITAPQRIDPRSDVYGLGVVLYEMLTGEPPFRGLTHLVLQQVAHEEPRPPRSLNDTIPRDLETICLHCLHKEPGRRYPSAGALAEDLRRFLAGEPIRARPVRAWERVAKWVKRRPAIAALLALVVLLTASGFGLVTWQWRRAETARGELADKAKELTGKARQLEIKNYVRNIGLAANELAMGNTGRAEELLDECPEALRGWEWHYLKRRLRDFPPLTLSLGQRISSGKGFDFAFSPDGRQLAAPCGDGTVKLWDVSTGQNVVALRGHEGDVVCVTFSPDGRRLASASEDTTVKIWDTTTGRELNTLPGHTKPVNGLTFSPDGRYLASTSYDQTVRLWDAMTGELLHTFEGSFTRSILVTPAFTPDGRRLAAPGVDNAVTVWDVKSGREALTLRGHTDQVFSVGFSPDGQRLFSVGWEGSVKVWDLPGSGEPGVSTPRVLTPRFTVGDHSHGAWCVTFSADGRRLALGRTLPDCTVEVYDVLTGQSVFTLEGHRTRVVSVAFSPDGRRLASGSLDKTVKLWEMETGQELLTLREHTNLVGHVAFDSQGRRLASSSEDGSIQIWDGSAIDEGSDRQILTLHGHARMVWGVAFSPAGKRLASAGGDKLVKVWDVTTGQEIFALRGHEDAVLSVAFSSDGERLASASNDKSVKLWNARTGEEIRTLREFQGGVRCVAFSPDGRRLATTDITENVQVWDAATGRELLSLRGHKSYVPVVTFSFDGHLLATCSVDGTVRLWDASTGAQVRKLEGHTNRVMSLAYSPDSRLLASGDAYQMVKVWEATTGNEVLSLVGHTNYVIAAAFSPDGRRLASASWQEVIVWDANTGEKIKTLRGLVGPIQSVAFSRDGKLAAAGGYKGKGEIKIWDASLWENKPTQP